jgi:transposase
MGTSGRQALERAVCIVAVARKLAGILHRMWIDGSDFQVGFGAKITQRLKLKPAS